MDPGKSPWPQCGSTVANYQPLEANVGARPTELPLGVNGQRFWVAYCHCIELYSMLIDVRFSSFCNGKF